MQAGAYSAPPQPSQSTGGEKYFDEALNAFRQNRFSDAITALNVGGYRYPSDPAIQELRSLVLFAKKDFQKASEALRPVLATSDGWDWSIFVEIYGPSNISNYAAQLRELESAVTETPSDASLRFLLAYHYRAAGHMQEAERQMKQAVFLHPRDELARAMLGMPPVIEPPRQEQPILESPTNAKSIPTPPVEELPLKSLQPQS
jgi:Flp pilus assembly protein TadD